MYTNEFNEKLNAAATRVHIANKRWWQDLNTGAPIKRDFNELMMLVVSELAESMEGHRKNLMDDKLPHRAMAEVELADALIRLLDMAGSPQYRTEFNATSWVYMWTDNFASNLFSLVRVISDRDVPLWEDAIADGVYGVIELAVFHDFDIWSAYEEKMAFNAQRHDHTREGRLAAGGKKY